MITPLASTLLALLLGVATPAQTPIPAGSAWVDCGADRSGVGCPHLERAHAERAVFRLGPAERELRAALRARRGAGLYAGDVLWELADLSLARGRPRTALAHLDVLQREAARHGDLERRAHALIEMVFLHERSREPVQALTRLEELRVLADSPYLPEATRRMIARRLI